MSDLNSTVAAHLVRVNEVWNRLQTPSDSNTPYTTLVPPPSFQYAAAAIQNDFQRPLKSITYTHVSATMPVERVARKIEL